MDLNIAARSLHQLRDTMFYKNCGLNMKQEGLVKRHIVGYMRGHFYIWVNPINYVLYIVIINGDCLGCNIFLNIQELLPWPCL